MIEVTRNPDRQLSKTCKGCQEPATCWLVVGDANQRTVIAFCDDCAEQTRFGLSLVVGLTGTEVSVVSASVECKRCEERGSLTCVECGR